jgi:ketol-acid reductoisomerase
LTLWGEHYNGYQLRAIAAEMQHNFEQISDVSETSDHRRLAAHHARGAEHGEAERIRPVAHGHRRSICKAANASVQAGNFAENNHEVRVDAGNLFTSREDLDAVVVGVVRGRPVYLRDVAEKITRRRRRACELCGLWHDEPGHDELRAHRQRASILL